MNRDEPQPGLSGTKRQRTCLFSAQQVIDFFEDLSELDGDNDADYPDSDLDDSDSDMNDMDDRSCDETDNKGESRGSADRMGRVPTDSGGVNLGLANEDGWNKVDLFR
ncbi:hypothetical protein BsWGS_27294 [Bradybaena similaris]